MSAYLYIILQNPSDSGDVFIFNVLILMSLIFKRLNHIIFDLIANISEVINNLIVFILYSIRINLFKSAKLNLTLKYIQYQEMI